jgi:hypothetical protein
MSELNPQLVAWNEANRVRQEIKANTFEQAMRRNDVRLLADQRQRRRFAVDTSTYATFRLVPPYEAEVNEILEDLLVLPLYRRQKKGAKGPRLKIGDHEFEQQPWAVFLNVFIRQQIAAGAGPKEMWEELCSRLDGLQCRPRQCVDPQTGKKYIEFKVVYSGDKAGKHVFGYRTFLNQISRQRRAKI